MSTINDEARVQHAPSAPGPDYRPPPDHQMWTTIAGGSPVAVPAEAAVPMTRPEAAAVPGCA